MLPKLTHPWNLSQKEAIRLQEELRNLVTTEDSFGAISTVAGVDMSVKEDVATAAVVVLSLPGLGIIERAVATMHVPFPYIPGLLSFREGPVILAAFEKLETVPDLAMFDGQGLAHPRRFGIASHMGLLLDLPSVGVGKTKLVGQYSEPAEEPGSASPLTDYGEVIGSVVRTKLKTNPLFISPGHRVSLETAVNMVLRCVRGYRLPEPTRQAHLTAGSV